MANIIFMWFNRRFGFSHVFFLRWPNSVHLREHRQYYNSIIFFCLSVRHYYSGKFTYTINISRHFRFECPLRHAK